jgi:hypothetical protein
MTLIIENTDINNPSSLYSLFKIDELKPLTNLMVFIDYRYLFYKMPHILLQDKQYF